MTIETSVFENIYLSMHFWHLLQTLPVIVWSELIAGSVLTAPGSTYHCWVCAHCSWFYLPLLGLCSLLLALPTTTGYELIAPGSTYHCWVCANCSWLYIPLLGLCSLLLALPTTVGSVLIALDSSYHCWVCTHCS